MSERRNQLLRHVLKKRERVGITCSLHHVLKSLFELRVGGRRLHLLLKSRGMVDFKIRCDHTNFDRLDSCGATRRTCFALVVDQLKRLCSLATRVILTGWSLVDFDLFVDVIRLCLVITREVVRLVSCFMVFWKL